MERMLVTGGAGFIGANFVRRFANRYNLSLIHISEPTRPY